MLRVTAANRRREVEEDAGLRLTGVAEEAKAKGNLLELRAKPR